MDKAEKPVTDLNENVTESTTENLDEEMLSVEKNEKKIRTVSMKKSVIIVATAILLIAVLIAGYLIFGEKDEETSEYTAIFSYEQSDVTRIEAENFVSGENFVLTSFMNGTTLEWNIEGQKYDDVNQNKVYNFVIYCAELKTKYTIENETDNLAEYGLDKPKSRVKVYYSDGTERTLNVGNFYGNNEGTYVYIDGDTNVYVVPSMAGNYLVYQLRDLLNLPSLTATGASAQNLYFIDSDRSVVNLAYIPGELSGEKAWYILQPTVCATDSDSIDEFFENLSGFTLSSVHKQSAGEDLSEYGFDTPVCELQSYNDDGKLLEHLVIGKKIDENTYYCALLSDEDAKFEDSPVYIVQSDQVVLIRPDIVKIADPYLVSLNIYWLRSGEFTLNGEKYEITVDRKTVYDDDGNIKLEDDGTESTVNTYFINGKQLDSTQFKTFYSKMLFLTVEGTTSDSTEKGEELFSYSLNVSIPITDSQTGEEYVKDTVYTGTYYRISDNYAVFKGNKSDNAVFTVRVRSIDNIANALALLLEGRMPTA